MKMKNYEKYLAGILLITWSPSYIGNTSVTVIHLFVLSSVVLLVFEVGWSPSRPSLHYSSIQGFVFFIAGVSFEGVGVGNVCFVYFV